MISKIQDYICKLTLKEVIIWNLVYLILIVFASRWDLDLGFKNKGYKIVTEFNPSFYSGSDAIYFYRWIRVMLKSISFVFLGAYQFIMYDKLNKKTNFIIFSVMYFLINLIVMVLLQVLMLPLIIISIFNYMLYALSFIIGTLSIYVLFRIKEKSKIEI